MKPYEVFLLILASLFGLLSVGAFLVDHLGLGGIVLSECLLVGLPVVAYVRARGFPVAGTLGFSSPGWRALVGGALAGAGGFWLVALAEVGLERLWPVPAELKESLKELVTGEHFILWEVTALAVAPALCEETLFRGLALPPLGARLGRTGGIVVTALLFAGFHMSLYRFMPTALLGLLLGLLRRGSVWPAIIFHAVNNLLVLALVRTGRDQPPLPTSVVGLAGLVAAVIALTVGIGLVLRSPQRA